MLKIIYKILLIFLIIIIILLLASFVWHRYRSKKEASMYKPPGQMVEINDHNMHVYSEGTGEIVLVFLAGGGTSSPLYDFKPLWSQLKSDYKIVVVEKAGYGFSEIAEVPRDIDSMLNETRQALQLANVSIEDGVYLIPHSMSALEAIRWAQLYPDEVNGLIGLDPAVPEVYDYLEISQINIQMIRFISKTGLLRFIPSAFESSAALKTNSLTSEDVKIYRSIFHRKTLTPSMLEEMKQVYKNAKVVKETKKPTDIPMYFFISNGKEVGVKNWSTILTTYLNDVEYHHYQILGDGHYVHNENTDLIVEEIKLFISQIESTKL